MLKIIENKCIHSLYISKTEVDRTRTLDSPGAVDEFGRNLASKSQIRYPQSTHSVYYSSETCDWKSPTRYQSRVFSQPKTNLLLLRLLRLLLVLVLVLGDCAVVVEGGIVLCVKKRSGGGGDDEGVDDGW